MHTHNVLILYKSEAGGRSFKMNQPLHHFLANDAKPKFWDGQKSHVNHSDLHQPPQYDSKGVTSTISDGDQQRTAFFQIFPSQILHSAFTNTCSLNRPSFSFKMLFHDTNTKVRYRRRSLISGDQSVKGAGSGRPASKRSRG